MNKNTEVIQSEKGQAIVLVAAVMVALLALAGLAIDGGNIFLQRRNIQNAADAAALAGTRQLAKAICGEGTDDAEIAYAVNHFAQLNKVQDLTGVTATYVNINEEELGAVGAGSVPVGATGIAVEIQNNLATYFMAVVGIDTVDVSGSALAMTSPPVATGGLRPVGVPLPLLDVLGPGDPFTISFGNCDQGGCNINYTGGQMQHRGMMNLAYVWHPGEAFAWPRAVDPSGDANVLKEWMENGFPGGTAFYVGDYIHAKPGRNSSVIGEAPVGKVILIPIFDAVPHYDNIPDPKPEAASQGGGYYYHIAGFLAFLITDANQGAGTIDGEFVQAYFGSGQVGGAEGFGFGEAHACQTHAQAINLWR